MCKMRSRARTERYSQSVAKGCAYQVCHLGSRPPGRQSGSIHPSEIIISTGYVSITRVLWTRPTDRLLRQNRAKNDQMRAPHPNISLARITGCITPYRHRSPELTTLDWSLTSGLYNGWLIDDLPSSRLGYTSLPSRWLVRRPAKSGVSKPNSPNAPSSRTITSDRALVSRSQAESSRQGVRWRQLSLSTLCVLKPRAPLLPRRLVKRILKTDMPPRSGATVRRVSHLSPQLRHRGQRVGIAGREPTAVWLFAMPH
jgi:hypothetical protein